MATRPWRFWKGSLSAIFKATIGASTTFSRVRLEQLPSFAWSAAEGKRHHSASVYLRTRIGFGRNAVPYAVREALS